MTDPRPTALSSNPRQAEPGPFSEDDLREQWNAQADEFNQWESLDSSEQLAWAQTRAIAAQPADQAEGPCLADVAELCAEFGFEPGSNGALLWADCVRPPIQDPLPILQEMITAAITRWRAPVAPPEAEALTHGRALLAQAEARAEDADLFRLWIHEASARPGKIANAISLCVTPDDYRKALRKLDPDYSNRAYPVDPAELRDPDLSDGLTASQHLDVLRGGEDTRVTAAPTPEESEAERVLRLAAIIREVDPADRIGGWAHQLAQALLAHPGFSGCHDGPADLPAQEEVEDLVEFLCAFASSPILTDPVRVQLRRVAELLKGLPHA